MQEKFILQIIFWCDFIGFKGMVALQKRFWKVLLQTLGQSIGFQPIIGLLEVDEEH
jgi:hypothetical protein